MDYHDHPFFTEQFASPAHLREANALVFTAEDFEQGLDPEVAMLAMDCDMAERDQCWRDEAQALYEENQQLRAENARLKGES